jgi:hypothetical protein
MGVSGEELVAAFREAEAYAASQEGGHDTAAYFYLAAKLGVDINQIREDG